MKINRRNCNHSEKTSIELIVKIIGSTLPVGGFGVLVTFLLAGTGLALPIVVAMITGGTAMLVYKEKIVKWISNKGFKCSKCGAVDWE
jgi:hypothetical protein